MGWLGGVEAAVIVVVVLCVLPFVWLFTRRRWLSSRGGLFDCGLRSADRVAGSTWTLGLARYEGDELRWYRAFGITLRPALVLDRRSTSFVSQREPDAAEHLVLFADHQVVRVRSSLPQGERVVELAMTPGSRTGLMSWLEASLPGGNHYFGD